MDVPGAKFPFTTYEGTDNNILNRRSSFVTPKSSPNLSRLIPRITRQKSRSAPGSRRGSPVTADRSGFMNKRREMEDFQVAFKRAYYKGSPRSSDRSNRLPRSGDLGIVSPYGLPNKPTNYDSNDSLYRPGRHGYYSQYPASTYIYDWDDNKPPKEPKTFNGVMTRFGQHTSLQGIPFILRGKRWYSKLLWTLLFLIALALTTWQFIEVINKYLAKDTSSSVKLGYANLEFPSVTICNINPIRKSMLDETSIELQRFLKSLSPPEDYNQGPPRPGQGQQQPDPDQQQPDPEQQQPDPNQQQQQPDPNQQQPDPNQQQPDPNQQQSDPNQQQRNQDQQPDLGQQQSNQTQQQSNQTQQQSGQGQRPGQDQQSGQGQRQPDQGQQQSNQTQQQPGQGQRPGRQQSGSGQQQSGQGELQGRRKRQTTNNDDTNIDFDQRRPPPPPREDFGQGNASVKFVYEEIFYDIVSDLTRQTRRQVGHQQDVFMLDCEFNGRQCRGVQWTRSLSREYGNCYTFNSEDSLENPLRSQRAGSQYGLNLILYVENHEYLRGITQGLGARFTIHPYKTLPFVPENGLSVATGTETFVGIKMVNIERIGDCGDGGAFEDEYGKSYTVEACITTCLDRVHIAGDCECYRPEFYNYYSKEAVKTLRPCSTEKDETCVYKWKQRDAQGNVKCNCKEECRGFSYDMTPSYNHWPDDSMWFTLVDLVCAQSESSCEHLKNTPDSNRRNVLRDNFMTLRIYYRDLNYETIEEKLDYEDSQFIADLGGTAGLWVGASVLTIMEVIDLLIQIAMFPCKRRRNVNERRPPPVYVNNTRI